MAFGGTKRIQAILLGHQISVTLLIHSSGVHVLGMGIRGSDAVH